MFLALIFAVKVPLSLGTPEISPVSASMVSPFGSPVALNVTSVVLVASTVAE